MRFVRSSLCIGLFLSVVASPAHAEGDPAFGATLAQEYCTRCHNVEPGGPLKMHPPSFASIAVFRSDDQIFGRIMFPPLHSSMPQIGYFLTPDNVEHLVAYIRSLEKK